MNSDASLQFQELARLYGWDDGLSKLLFSLPQAAINQYILETKSYDREGWRYILPETTASASVLCLDMRFGNTVAAFAEIGASVTAIHFCPIMMEVIRYQVASMNISNIKMVQVSPQIVRLPFPDNTFDAFIFHDVVGSLVMHSTNTLGFNRDFFINLFKESHRLTKADGFSYFGLKNRLSYDAIKGKLLSIGKRANDLSSGGVSISRIKGLIKQAGFQNLELYPYLIERGRVSEIVPKTGYRSLKNSLAASEKLKQIVLGRIGIKYFAPAYGLVCAKDSPRPNQIMGFAQNLVDQKVLDSDPKIPPYFQRYISLPSKAFITLNKFNKSNKAHLNTIIVIPTKPVVLRWRQKEITTVNELRSAVPELASKLPPLYYESFWRGETYFALSELPGITVDRNVPHLDRLTNHAVKFLIRFNQMTIREVIIDECLYEELVGSLILEAASTYPSIQDTINRIGRLLRTILLGKLFSVVWLHGDYKLENLLFNKKTLEISGIIDWEQSRRNGLPLLDLFYLLTYNRIIKEGDNFFEVYRDVIERKNFLKNEKYYIDTYLANIPVAAELRPILIYLFFIHHIGCRSKYNLNIEEWRYNLCDGLDRMEDRLSLLTM